MKSNCRIRYMSAQPDSSATWRIISLSGVGLIAIGIGAGYFDVWTHFYFEFISSYFGFFLLAILVGIFSSFIGLIGWAKLLGRQRRARMAALVLISPWLAMLLGYPIAGTNIHGPSVFVMLLIIPASILALLLFFMSVAVN